MMGFFSLKLVHQFTSVNMAQEIKLVVALYVSILL